MAKTKLAGARVIGAVEIGTGLLGAWQIASLFTYQGRTGQNPGMAWLLMPLLAAWALFFLLGAGMWLQLKVARIAHLFFIPVIMAIAVLMSFFLGMSFGDPLFSVNIICLFLGALTLYYLSRRDVKSNFS